VNKKNSSNANELVKKFEENLFKEQIVSLEKEIIQLRLCIEAKDKEIKQLKSMQLNLLPNVLPISDEEQISLIQLETLKKTALERQLNLDEVRMFDILVKNKRLSQGSSTDNNKTIHSLKDVNTNDLIQIASKKVEQ